MKGKATRDVKLFLDEMVEKYNRKNFIDNDPIQIPHLFSKKQDKFLFFKETKLLHSRATSHPQCEDDRSGQKMEENSCSVIIRVMDAIVPKTGIAQEQLNRSSTDILNF